MTIQLKQKDKKTKCQYDKKYTKTKENKDIITKRIKPY